MAQTVVPTQNSFGFHVSTRPPRVSSLLQEDDFEGGLTLTLLEPLKETPLRRLVLDSMPNPTAPRYAHPPLSSPLLPLLFHPHILLPSTQFLYISFTSSSTCFSVSFSLVDINSPSFF